MCPMIIMLKPNIKPGNTAHPRTCLIGSSRVGTQLGYSEKERSVSRVAKGEFNESRLRVNSRQKRIRQRRAELTSGRSDEDLLGPASGEVAGGMIQCILGLKSQAVGGAQDEGEAWGRSNGGRGCGRSVAGPTFHQTVTRKVKYLDRVSIEIIRKNGTGLFHCVRCQAGEKTAGEIRIADQTLPEDPDQPAEGGEPYADPTVQGQEDLFDMRGLLVKRRTQAK
ncbi:hypothetical protein K438DRAFT_1758838 [Mycena galopus ATCC 62051]|nr:hypothetical protein K438DRAFT_1780213 [Mycena galopus ATCC 62051]KAF8200640.1 hypothetical protein K438DRAFT_1758838 [Mycena galopus ATCC 62051]